MAVPEEFVLTFFVGLCAHTDKLFLTELFSGDWDEAVRVSGEREGVWSGERKALLVPRLHMHYPMSQNLWGEAQYAIFLSCFFIVFGNSFYLLPYNSEMGACYIAQVDLKLKVILLFQPPL